MTGIHAPPTRPPRPDVAAHKSFGAPFPLHGETLFKDLPAYPLFLDRHEIDRTFDDPFYLRLIDSAAFQRLRKISFLGALDYLRPSVNRGEKRHSRFQHSLGVGLLALRYARFNRLSLNSERTIVAAALLHDVGHGPLSHSLEPFFRDQFGIGHHELGRRIVFGQHRAGKEVSRLLSEYSVEADEVVDLVEGGSGSPHGIIFSNPLNIDTLDGIVRCASSVSPHATVPPAPVLFESMLKWEPKTEQRCDAFWGLKDRVYRWFILSGLGLVADRLCTLYAEGMTDRLSRDHYLQNDKLFRKNNRVLFKELQNIKIEDLFRCKRRSGTFRFREYNIDENHTPSCINDLHLRYTHKTTSADLFIPIINYEKMKMGVQRYVDGLE